MRIKIIRILLLLLLGMSLWSCNTINTKNETPSSSEKTDYNIHIIDTLNKTDLYLSFEKNSFTLDDLPDFSTYDNYFLGYSINNDDNYLASNTNYHISEKMTLYAKFGIKKDAFLIDDISDIYLYTHEEISSKHYYVDSVVRIEGNDYNLPNSLAQIRLRGNSSLHVPKKSYKIKFDKKHDVFGFGEDKEWALIANYFDPSHLRNFYAYTLAKTMGIDYSVDCKFVNVYLNDVDQGLYLFTETVKDGSSRVDIKKNYTSTDIEIPFLVELDFKIEENNPNYIEDLLDKEFFFLDNTNYNGKKYQIATKYPKTFTNEHITFKQYNYIKKYMHDVYSSVRNRTYKKFIDIDNFIDYFIVQELFLNIDQDYSSVFMYKPVNDVLHMGPVWDFDLSSGNCSYVGTYDPFRQMKDVNGGNYLFVTLMEDKNFRNKFLERLNELNELLIIPTLIDSFNYNLNYLKPYADRDNQIWNNLNEPNWARPDWLLNITYTEQVNYLKDFLDLHYKWMLKNM